MPVIGMFNECHTVPAIIPGIYQLSLSLLVQKVYENVRNFETKFFGYYRMSIKSFDELLVLLTPHISRSNTSIRLEISAEERLTITIR